MKSIRLAKPEKLTQNWQDHSKIIYFFYGKLRKKRSRFFLDMRFSRGFHRKSKFSFSTLKSDHQWLRFPSKSAQSWKTLKNACFWHCIALIEWSRFFPENPAVSVFVHYCPLTYCQISEKSECGKYHKFWPRTDGRSNTVTWPNGHWLNVSLTSWRLDFSTSRLSNFLSSWLLDFSNFLSSWLIEFSNFLSS